jgi:hypothetical protein
MKSFLQARSSAIEIGIAGIFGGKAERAADAYVAKVACRTRASYCERRSRRRQGVLKDAVPEFGSNADKTELGN